MLMPWGWGFGLIWALFMLAIFVLAVIGLVLLVRWLWAQTRLAGGKESPESPLEIVKRRYARGEIDQQEYEAKIRDLGG